MMYRLIILIALLFPSLALSKQQPSLLLIDATTKGIIVSEDPGVVRSVASITKLITALVALDYYPLDTELQLSNKIFSKLLHKSATVEQLITTLVVKSDNNAAETLAEHYAGGRTVFVKAMNHKAQQLGLHSTTFADPSGLGVWNRSTAYEVAVIMNHAMAHPKLSEIAMMREAKVAYKKGKKTKTSTITNTNTALMKQHKSIIGSKTGFTNQAGWCVTVMVEEKGRRYIAVVLGARGSSDRNKQAELLIKKIPALAQNQHRTVNPNNNEALSIAPTQFQYR